MSYKEPDILRYPELNSAAMKDLLKVFSQRVQDLRTINEIKNIHSAKGKGADTEE